MREVSGEGGEGREGEARVVVEEGREERKGGKGTGMCATVTVERLGSTAREVSGEGGEKKYCERGEWGGRGGEGGRGKGCGGGREGGEEGR